MSSILLALLLASAPDDCANPMAQQEMNRCAARGFEQADAELNAQWRLTLAAVRAGDGDPIEGDTRPSGEARLREAQRAWVSFRDAHCAVHGYQARGGSLEPLLLDGCRAALTRERTRQLKELTE
ncbi:MAG TPA: lysozyme inhibitor LprI family protein [Allosphingosinicella sp.]|jgi:uncharacterized protein YecT (DUF1311 family)